MVAATSNPKMLRVEFEQNVSEVSKVVVVCFIHARLDGVKIYYSHHLLLSRPIPKGPWDSPKVVRMALSPLLRAQVSVCLWQEMWTAVMGAADVDTAPFEPEADMTEVEG